MGSEEAAALRESWATLEESFGWDTPEALPWQAAFVEVASRTNHAAARAATALEVLDPTSRKVLWTELIEHLQLKLGANRFEFQIE